MTLKLAHHKDPEKWWAFSKKEQMLNIAAELSRIHHEMVQGEDEAVVQSAYERCLDLIDMTIADQKWKGEIGELFQFRDAITSLYIGKITPEIPRLLYTWLVKLSETYKS